MQGRVIKSTGSWYMVRSTDNVIHECRIRGRFRLKNYKLTNPVAVGDIVDIAPEKDETGKWVITRIHERSNYLIRKANKLSSQYQIIASNLDCVLLIATLSKPRTTTIFIDRILLAAEAYHIPVILVFNKRDLYTTEEMRQLEEYRILYESAGYQVFTISAYDEIDLELLKRPLSGQIALITGHSGVGKSTIMNQLNPSLNLKTGKISSYHERGMHSTTFAEMHPVFGNSYIIDTPGIKDFGVVEFEKDNISMYFRDMRRFAQNCRFNNCTHVDEPGCKVREAVQSGALPLSRFESYLNILLSLENQ